MSQRRSGCFGGEKNTLPLPRIEPGFYDNPASSLITVLTELSSLKCSIQRSVLPVFSDSLAATKSFTFREESSGVLFVLLPPDFTLLCASRNVSHCQMLRNCEPLSLTP